MKKIDFRILIIIILLIILISMCYFYLKDEEDLFSNNANFNFSKMNENFNNNSSSNKTILATTSEVSPSLLENIELHATYYLQESYVKTNQSIKSGENILKYTNGKYLTAPYDCVITDIKIPEKESECTNEHYIKIGSVNSLQVQIKVDETKINFIELGQEATIKMEAYEDKTLYGYVTKISSTASNGKFTVTVEFQNDGDIMIGMTSSVTIKEK